MDAWYIISLSDIDTYYVNNWANDLGECRYITLTVTIIMLYNKHTRKRYGRNGQIQKKTCNLAGNTRQTVVDMLHYKQPSLLLCRVISVWTEMCPPNSKTIC